MIHYRGSRCNSIANAREGADTEHAGKVQRVRSAGEGFFEKAVLSQGLDSMVMGRSLTTCLNQMVLTRPVSFVVCCVMNKCVLAMRGQRSLR
jgi:hypothetical protein